MNLQIKLFDYRGTPVYFKFLFLLLFLWVSPSFVAAIFISMLLHELAHAHMAKRLGYKVNDIQIGLFIGQANMDIDSIKQTHSIRIVAAGPWINMMLWASLSLINIFLQNHFINSLVIVNFIFFIFNIIPIFPLDGGRILRSALMLKTKNRERSIFISSIISLIFSVLLLIWSLMSFDIVTIIFSVLFLVFSMKELGWIKV